MNTNATSFNPNAGSFKPQTGLKQSSAVFIPNNQMPQAIQSSQPPPPMPMPTSNHSYNSFYPLGNQMQGAQYGPQNTSFNDFNPNTFNHFAPPP